MEAAERDEKLFGLRKTLEKSEKEFLDQVKASNEAKLKEDFFKLTKAVEDLLSEKDNHKELRQLKAGVSALNGGFRDRKKAFALKIQYLLLTLQDRGQL